MTEEIPQKLFIDTGAFIAHFDPRDIHHDAAEAIFGSIKRGESPFRFGPLYTSRYVLSEVATVLLYGTRHAKAIEAMDSILDSSSSFNILSVGEREFDRAYDRFKKYDDQEISFVDHTSGVLADIYDIDHVFAFDSDFEILGLNRVPST